MSKVVKRGFKYRFYPTDSQAAELLRTFGCVRKVYNLALAARSEAWKARQEKVGYSATSAMLTSWKKSEELAFLCEVSCVPLQQTLRHLQTAFADRRRDYLHKLTTRIVRETQTIVIEDLTVKSMLKHPHLARAISDGGWRQLRTMLEYTASWYGRNLVTVNRWFPSTKLCSTCGVVAENLPLSQRTWTCQCGTVHDRDVNAAKNLLAAGLAVTACGAYVRPQRDPSLTGSRL
ncbi:transposase [Catellatospora sp. NPDC049133]|uniref:RNA-guided endonuclease InsQ/TnpB family protein n=1 Tax=Catellatospora sp. NPDC049133 TaxID=3155499 RepID=UPI0034046DA5